MAEPYNGEYATPVVHRASRIAAAAHGGQILCSAAVVDAAHLPGVRFADLGLHRLRGFDDRERLYQVVAPGLALDFPRPRGVAADAHNLPVPVTDFIGRGTEQRELRALLERERLVVVVGPGGAGKTRLAVELAAGLVADHPDGVWFADFATAADADLVEVCLADALGLRPEPGRHGDRVRGLVTWPGDRPLLAAVVPVLDRLGVRVADAVAVVGDDGAPASRRRLGDSGLACRVGGFGARFARQRIGESRDIVAGST